MEKKKSKVWIKILILLLILIIPAAVTYVVWQLNLHPDLKLGTVSSVTLNYGEQQKKIKNQSDVDFFVSLAENGEAIAETVNPLSSYRKCEVIYHKLNRDVTYVFYLSDSVNDCVYADPDKNLFLVPAEEAAKLLAHPMVTGYAVSYAVYPTLEFSQGGKTYGAKLIEGNWTYAKANETKSYKDISEKFENIVTLPQGENLNFKFSLEPDFCSITLQNEKGEILHSGDPKEMELITLETDAILSMTVKCDWYQEAHEEYFGTITYTFDIHYDVPTQSNIDRQTVSPGEMVVITIEHSTTKELAVVPSFSAGKIEQENVDGVWTVQVPVADDAVAGEYTITVVGSDVEENYTVTILPTA